MINWSDENGLLGGFKQGWKSGVETAFSPERRAAEQRRANAVRGAQEQVRAAHINSGLQALGRGADASTARAGAAGFRTNRMGRWGPGGYQPGSFAQKALPDTNYGTQAQAIGQGLQEAANAKAGMYKELNQITADEERARAQRIAAERAEETRQAERLESRQWAQEDLVARQTFTAGQNALKRSHELLKIENTWDRKDSAQANALVNELQLMREQGGIKGTLLDRQLAGQIRAIQERGSISKLLQEGANAHDVELVNHEFGVWKKQQGIEAGYDDAASARDFTEETALNAQNIAGRLILAAENNTADWDQMKYTLNAKGQFLNTKVDFWKWKRDSQNAAALAEIDRQGIVDRALQDELLDATEQAQLRKFQHEHLRDDTKYAALSEMVDQRLSASQARLDSMQAHDVRMQDRSYDQTLEVWGLNRDLTLLRDSNNYDHDYGINAQAALAKMDQIKATYEGKNEGIVMRINAERANLEANIAAKQLLQDDAQAAKMEELGFTRETQQLILDDTQEGDLIAQRQSDIAKMDQILASGQIKDTQQREYLTAWRDIAAGKNANARTIQEMKNANTLNVTQMKVDGRMEELGIKNEYDAIKDVRLFDQDLIKQSQDIENKLRLEAAKAENKGTYVEKLYNLRADELKLKRETSRLLLGDGNKYKLEQLGVKQDYALKLQKNQLSADEQEYVLKETNRLKVEADKIRSSDSQKAAQLDNLVRIAEMKIKATSELQTLKDSNALIAQESRQANQQLLASVYGVKFKVNPDEFLGTDPNTGESKIYFQQLRDGVGYMVDAYGNPAPEGLSFSKAPRGESKSDIEKLFDFYRSKYPEKSVDDILAMAKSDSGKGGSSATTKQKDYQFLTGVLGKSPEEAFNIVYVNKGKGEQPIDISIDLGSNASRRQEVDISGYVTDYNDATQLKAKITNVIANMPAETSAGIFAATGGKIKDITGFQNQISTFRTLATDLINSGALENLPPGSASEADVALVKRGVPDENANVEALRDWMVALERLANYRQRYNKDLITHIETTGNYSGFLTNPPAYDPEGLDQASTQTRGIYTGNVSASEVKAAENAGEIIDLTVDTAPSTAPSNIPSAQQMEQDALDILTGKKKPTFTDQYNSLFGYTQQNDDIWTGQ